MIKFILNSSLIETVMPEGMALVDFIRNEMQLTATKIGCREGDCGACTVIEGTLKGGIIEYKSIMSCLTPLGNVHGKHIVTLEGINSEKLSPVQQAIVDMSATQCGFCTPGFVMSFTAHSMDTTKSTIENTINSVAGNMCRCTGYKSIERAAEIINTCLQTKDFESPIKWLVENNYIPSYFIEIPERLACIEPIKKSSKEGLGVAGGTDLMVQKPEIIEETEIRYFRTDVPDNIMLEVDVIKIGGGVTVSQLKAAEFLENYVPKIKDYLTLVSSEPIRNMASIAGNFVNASPIGDLTILFLALNVWLEIKSNSKSRIVYLKDFYNSYKNINLNPEEYIEFVCFKTFAKQGKTNFEKVSKRTHLDIASVNSAIYIETEGSNITTCRLSFGGVAPIPLLAKETSDFACNKEISVDFLNKLNDMLQNEVSPISDVRGSIEYKRLLIRNLLYSHFIKLFPEFINPKELIINNKA